MMQLNSFQSEDSSPESIDQNNHANSNEENGSTQKIPSFFLLLLDLKSEGQLGIFEDHMKDSDVSEKLKVALAEMIESYKVSQDTDIAVAFLKNVKDLTRSFVKKKWGPKFIKENLIPSVFQIIIISSESSIDQNLIGKSIRALDTCLGQNLSLSDIMADQTQSAYEIQKKNEQNRFYFTNLFPTLLEYLRFEQKQYLVEMFLQQSFFEPLPEVDYKNIGEYLPQIKQMLSPLQFYMKELAYFKKIDEEMKQRQFDLLQIGANALFLKKAYQMKYFKTVKIQATHYLKGNNKVKIEKEDVLMKIKVEGEHCLLIFKILIKLIQSYIDGASTHKHELVIMQTILECLFFYLDNSDLQEYNLKRKYLNIFISNKPFIEKHLSESVNLLFQNYSKMFAQNTPFDYSDYITRNFIPMCSLITVSPQVVEECLYSSLNPAFAKVRESIYWLSQIPQFVSYFEEQKYSYNKQAISRQIERIVMRKPQLQGDDQSKLDKIQLATYMPENKFRDRQDFLDDYYYQIKHKSYSKKWREREEAVLQLKDLITYMDIRSLFVSVVPDFFDFCYDKIAQVRTVAAWEVDSLFARLPPRNPASNIFYQALIDNVSAFHSSSAYWLRQIFIVMCASLMQKNSRIFLSYFSDKFASLTEDRVTNVRISLAKTVVGHIKNKMPLSQHQIIRKLIGILGKDSNKDVRDLVAEYNHDLLNWEGEEEQDYDSKVSDECSNTQLNKSEVEMFTKGNSLNMNMLSTDLDVDPFDILLNDSTPKKESSLENKRRSTLENIHDYVDEKLPSPQKELINLDLINDEEHYVPQGINLLEEFHSEADSLEHNKISNQLEKEVEEEEKWPDQQQIIQEVETNSETKEKSLTPIDLLFDLEDNFTNSMIEQKKSSVGNELNTPEMIQTTN